MHLPANRKKMKAMKDKGLGCILRPAKIRNYNYISVCGANKVELPKTYMIPEENMPLVDDQGSINSCVAHGISKAIEGIYLKNFKKRKRYSRGYIYGNPICRGNCLNYGMFTDDAIKGVIKCGDVSLSDFDIDEEVPKIIKLFNEREDLKDEAKLCPIKSYVEIPIYAMLTKRAETIKEAIYTNQVPIVIASSSYFGGGHCIIAVGWDEHDNIIFQNSWGERYGQKGYGHMPVSYIDEAYLLLTNEILLPFEDIDKDSWYYNDIKTAYYSAIMTGSSETTFEPENNITRAEVSAIGTRVLSKIENNFNNWAVTMNQLGNSVNKISILKYGKNTPVDVLNTEWYYDYIRYAVGTGFMLGDNEGTFRPEDNISRAEFASTVVRLADMSYRAFSSNNTVTDMPKLDIKDISYTDVNKDDWYTENLIRAYSYGLMNGDDDGRFRPDEYITRAESAVTIVRLMSLIDSWLSYFCDNN